MTTFPISQPFTREECCARPLNICVFCGARTGTSPELTQAAEETGSLIGRRGHRLVYGGGGSGLMGSVAWAASRHGADITGITPRFLYERERAIAAPPQRTRLTETMLERKSIMLADADAFLALPGGYGTLDEILEVISLGYLGVLKKPIVIVDVARVWEGFLRTVTRFCELGLAFGGEGVFFEVASSPAAAFDAIEAAFPAVPTGIGRRSGGVL